MNSSFRPVFNESNFLKPLENSTYVSRPKFEENLTPVAQEFPFNLSKEIKAMHTCFSPGKTSEIKAKITGSEKAPKMEANANINNARESKSLANKEYRSAFLKKFSTRQSEKPFLRNINKDGETMDHVVRANLFEEEQDKSEFQRKAFGLDRNLLYRQTEEIGNGEEFKPVSRSRSQEKFCYQGAVNQSSAGSLFQEENGPSANEFRKCPIVKRSPAAKEKEFSLPSGSSIIEHASLKINPRIQEFLSDRESRIFLSNSEICNKMGGASSQEESSNNPAKPSSGKEEIEEISSLLLSRVEPRCRSPGGFTEKFDTRDSPDLHQAACKLPMTEQGTLQYLFDEIAVLKKSEEGLRRELEFKHSENEELSKRLKEVDARLVYVGKEKEIAELKMKKYERDLQEYVVKLKEAKKEILNSKMVSSNFEQLDSRLKALTEENEALKKKNADFEVLLKNVLFERELKKKGQLAPAAMQLTQAPNVQENVKPVVPPLFTAALRNSSYLQIQKSEAVNKKPAEPGLTDLCYRYYKPASTEDKENARELKAPKAAQTKGDLLNSSPSVSKHGKAQAQKRSSSANHTRARGTNLNNTIALDKLFKAEEGLDSVLFAQTTKNSSTSLEKNNRSEFLKINDVLNRSMPRKVEKNMPSAEEEETENHQIKNIIDNLNIKITEIFQKMEG